MEVKIGGIKMDEAPERMRHYTAEYPSHNVSITWDRTPVVAAKCVVEAAVVETPHGWYVSAPDGTNISAVHWDEWPYKSSREAAIAACRDLSPNMDLETMTVEVVTETGGEILDGTGIITVTPMSCGDGPGYIGDWGKE